MQRFFTAEVLRVPKLLHIQFVIHNTFFSPTSYGKVFRERNQILIFLVKILNEFGRNFKSRDRYIHSRDRFLSVTEQFSNFSTTTVALNKY